MKILYSAPRFHTNQYYAIKSLMEKNHKISFLTCYSDFSETYLDIYYEQVKFCKFNKLISRKMTKTKEMIFYRKYAIPNIIWLFGKLHDINPDIIIVREWSITNICIALFGKLYKKTVIFYNQEPVFKNYPENSRSLLQKLYKARISPVLGIGNYKDAKDFFVPFVIDSNQVEREYFYDNKINILVIGKYTDRKKIYEFLEFFANKVNNQDIMVTVVGQATLKEQVEYYEKCSQIKSKNINLVRNVPYEEIARYYLSNDIFILTSEKEPASYSVLEAMKYGLCVFTPDDNGTSSYIENGVNGYIYPTNDFDYVINKINILSQDKKAIEKMARESKNIIIKKFSPEKYSNAIDLLGTL